MFMVASRFNDDEYEYSELWPMRFAAYSDALKWIAENYPPHEYRSMEWSIVKDFPRENEV